MCVKCLRAIRQVDCVRQTDSSERQTAQRQTAGVIVPKARGLEVHIGGPVQGLTHTGAADRQAVLL